VLAAPLRPARDLGVGSEWYSTPESITFATSGDRFAHGLYYPPTNPDFTAPDDERAPLIVLSHGGPTSAARPQLNLGVQFWTSRGFGVVDVNYGGSTGYGRSYRRRLIGEWGIVDVDDSIAATRLLVDRGDADRDRLIIRGGSAGGFTTLSALTFRDVFAAGCSLYGVADLEALARDTHKFEARYLDSLVGPWPARSDIYAERSPIHHVEDLECPLIVLQGLEDEIVPPNQSQMIVEALDANGFAAADVDWLVPHQANIRIIESTAKKLGLPMERVVVTVDRHANTSAASIPLALDVAVRDGRIRPGHLVLLEGVGGGFTWGSVLLRW
jgi:dipeptidyl aminopeptidase/acylaminoacyl peptidase